MQHYIKSYSVDYLKIRYIFCAKKQNGYFLNQKLNFELNYCNTFTSAKILAIYKGNSYLFKRDHLTSYRKTALEY
jgi:hypothetical protein